MGENEISKIHNELKEKKHDFKIENYNEYNFVAGQLIKYYNFVSKYPLNLKVILISKTEKTFKRRILNTFKHFSFPNTEKGNLAKNFYQQVMNFEVDESKKRIGEEYFIAGYVLDLV